MRAVYRPASGHDPTEAPRPPLAQQECRDLLAMLAELGLYPAVRHYRARESIPQEELSASALCILLSGALKSLRFTSRAKPNLYLIGPWDTFGRLTSAGGALLPDTIVAAADSEVAKVPGILLKRALNTRPELTLKLATLQELRIMAYERRATRLLLRGTQARLADLLLWMAARFGDRPPEETPQVNLGLTHEELGAMIGCTRESTNEALNRLRRSGLVAISRGSITVLDAGGLEEVARGRAVRGRFSLRTGASSG